MALASAASLVPAASGSEPTGAGSAPPTSIVLVHGAFADGSAWTRVIPGLQQQGFRVVAVQNPLASYAEDVATTRRVIEAQPGPVIAVGHSYGGAVITAAAAGSGKVKALVYVAALMPDAGEGIGELYESFGEPELKPALVADAAGFLSIDPARLHALFAHDVTAEEARVMGATQKPIHGSIFAESPPQAAWKEIPSYYLVATGDRAIRAALQRHMVQRAGAKSVEVDASHVPFLSQPEAVIRFIGQAARETVPAAPEPQR